MGTILVVDDEESIRSLVKRVLERRGHRVIACQTAAEALAEPGPFDLLLVDLVLPEVNGRELADALRARWPSLPIILMSGYLAQDGLVPEPPAIFLQKPMLPSVVVETVERMLSVNQS